MNLNNEIFIGQKICAEICKNVEICLKFTIIIDVKVSLLLRNVTKLKVASDEK